jgi:SAM-dependent methyltransferase
LDVLSHNQAAWDRWAKDGIRWTLPVSPQEIAAARRGDWKIYLTESKPVPRDWFPAQIAGLQVLGLAAGGGQQAPILAAAGARVTVLDCSGEQLARDRMVAAREGLELAAVQGDMGDLSMFSDSHFDLIVHPTSNLFIADVAPVWAEAYRVLRPGGYLLAGFLNPVEYIFDRHELDQGRIEVKYPLPYSDTGSITEDERRELYGEHAPVEFSHSLEAQIGGQLAAGFLLTGFFEAKRESGLISDYMPTYIATRALKSPRPPP